MFDSPPLTSLTRTGAFSSSPQIPLCWASVFPPSCRTSSCSASTSILNGEPRCASCASSLARRSRWATSTTSASEAPAPVRGARRQRGGASEASQRCASTRAASRCARRLLNSCAAQMDPADPRRRAPPTHRMFQRTAADISRRGTAPRCVSGCVGCMLYVLP